MFETFSFYELIFFYLFPCLWIYFSCLIRADSLYLKAISSIPHRINHQEFLFSKPTQFFFHKK
ncbi:hypothetical protein EF405_18775 [Cyclobacteriaceae bacterium YHN15]|nr:hypothetical protein EF405_18775 [Cyclobacteriaceae bacterium YHN15]